MDGVLRTTGGICLVGVLVGLPVTLVLALFDAGAGALWSAAVTAVSFCVPKLVMSIHIATPDGLTEEQRSKWNQVAWGADGFIAAFAYLLRRDRRLR
jgi:hypothetical protein